jgi:hypothetical protein
MGEPKVFVSYERKAIRCGKSRCACASGDPRAAHGPYWYAFWNDPRSGKKRCKYLGKNFAPPAARQVYGERRRAPEVEPKTRRATRARGSSEPPPPGPRIPASQDERDAAFFGVSVRVTQLELRRVWRERLLAVHPDRHQGPERASKEREAQVVNEVFQRMCRLRKWKR